MDATGPLRAGKLALHNILNKQLLLQPLALAQALEPVQRRAQLVALGGRPPRLRPQQCQQAARRQRELLGREPHVGREGLLPLVGGASALVRHVVVVVVGVGAGGRRRTRARRRRVRRVARSGVPHRPAGVAAAAAWPVGRRQPLQREPQPLRFVLRVRAVVLGDRVRGP